MPHHGLQHATAIGGLKVALLFAGAMRAREVAGMDTIVDACGGRNEICYFTDASIIILNKLAFTDMVFEHERTQKGCEDEMNCELTRLRYSQRIALEAPTCQFDLNHG